MDTESKITLSETERNILKELYEDGMNYTNKLENEKQNMITKFGKRFENNLPNFMNYYRKKEKEINYQANNMIRKISKLYDLLPDESEQNSNIKDLDEWYLVQKNKKLKPIDFTKQKIDF